jgi:hypothetical protein
VTTKTLLRLFARDRASQRIFERNRHRGSMSNREVETTQLLEITHTRFIKLVVVTKEKRLPDVTLSEAVKYRLAYAVFSVGNAVEDRVAFARDVVRVSTVAKGQLAFRSNYAAIGRDFKRLAHRRV